MSARSPLFDEDKRQKRQERDARVGRQTPAYLECPERLQDQLTFAAGKERTRCRRAYPECKGPLLVLPPTRRVGTTQAVPASVLAQQEMYVIDIYADRHDIPVPHLYRIVRLYQ